MVAQEVADEKNDEDNDDENVGEDGDAIDDAINDAIKLVLPPPRPNYIKNTKDVGVKMVRQPHRELGPTLHDPRLQCCLPVAAV